MPSPRKSTRSAAPPIPEAVERLDFSVLEPEKRARAKGLVKELIELDRMRGRPSDPQTIAHAIDLGIFAEPAEAEIIAHRLLPDYKSGTGRELAAAKERIGRVVATLLSAQAEVRKVIDALHTGHSGPAGEPPCLELREVAEVAAVEPGRYHLDLSLVVGRGPGVFFTRAADDLAVEIFWATETEDQLGDMIRRLTELAARDERIELLHRRAALVETLSPGARDPRKGRAA